MVDPDGSLNPEQALHPSLARIAASYDYIISEMDAGRLSPAQARAKMTALIARDDQGVRWTIDPQTGEWLRITITGDLEYDSPPRSGVLTADAFNYSNQVRDDNPALHLHTFTNENMNKTPLDGVEPNRSNTYQPTKFKHTLDKVTDLSWPIKVTILVGVILVLWLIFSLIV